MAAIDKTYTKYYSEYKELIDWAKNQEFICPNGCKIHPIDYIYEWEENSFSGNELPVMNTSCTVDYFLIKSCPLPFVQDRMKEAYGEGCYNSILNGTSEYDTFVKDSPGTKFKINGFRKNYLYKIIVINGKIYQPKFDITISKNEEPLWYSKEIHNWIEPNELGNYSTNFYYFGKSKKALLRKIRKWKLPKGCIVTAIGRYYGEELTIEVK